MRVGRLSFEKIHIKKYIHITLLLFLGGATSNVVFADKNNALDKSISITQPEKLPMRPRGVRPDPRPELINPLRNFRINSSSQTEGNCSCKLVCKNDQCETECTPAGCTPGGDGGGKACSCTWKCTTVDGIQECIKTCVPAGCEGSSSKSRSLDISDAQIKDLLTRPRGVRPDPLPELIQPKLNINILEARPAHIN